MAQESGGWIAAVIFLCSIFLLSNSCGYHLAPKVIEADGTSYMACSGFVHVSSDSPWFGGETTYSLSFTDAAKTDMILKGVHKIVISSVPEMVSGTLPAYLPNPQTDKDKDGKPFSEGVTYTFSDGERAIIRNGQWVAAMRKNPVCANE